MNYEYTTNTPRCRNCGTPQQGPFCGKCGSPIGYPTAVEQPMHTGVHWGNPRPSGSKRIALIAIFSACLVLLVAVPLSLAVRGVMRAQAAASSNYRSFNDNYGSPDDNYGSPYDNYGGPDDNYGGPYDNYGGPDDNYGGPDDNYGLNNNNGNETTAMRLDVLSVSRTEPAENAEGHTLLTVEVCLTNISWETTAYSLTNFEIVCGAGQLIAPQAGTEGGTLTEGRLLQGGGQVKGTLRFLLPKKEFGRILLYTDTYEESILFPLP